jgi:predicted Zn-dependent peptidase
VTEPKAECVELDSGLRLIAVVVPHARTAVVEFISEAGSRYDPPGLEGISHFLEHMLYRGTSSHPGPHELALAFERRGGLLEAATYIDHGSVALSVPPENVIESVPVLCEVLRAPLLSGLDVERAIVREEILETLDDTGRLVEASDLARAHCFPQHPLGHPITGSIEALERFDARTLMMHHDHLYVGAASVVAIAGAVEPERIFAAFAGGMKGFERGARPVSVAPKDQPAGPIFSFVRYSDSQSHLRILFRAPGSQDPQEPAIEMLLRLLDDGMSTRLYHRICNTLGLCYDVSAYYEAWNDVGVVEFAGDCAHERVAALGQEILELIAQLRDQGPSEEEFLAAKQRARWQHRELLDDPAELTGFYGYAELKRTARDPMERTRELEAVSLETLRKTAFELFTPENLVVVCVGEPQKRVRDKLEKVVQTFT